jgi:hypothetical protein
MPQRAGERPGARQKPKSTTEKPMSLLATRHFQKFTPITEGTISVFKKSFLNFYF